MQLFYIKRYIPEVKSYPALFQNLLGFRWYIYGAFCVYLLLYLYCVADIFVMIESWRELFPGMSKVAAFLVSVLLCWSLMQTRSMQNLGYLSILGALTIIVPVTFTTIQISKSTGTEGFPRGDTSLWPKSFAAGVMGLTAIFFSFSGHAIFFELIHELRDPSDFPKALLTSQLAIFAVLITLQSIVYHIAGDATWIISPLTLSLPPGVLRNIVAAFVLVHLAVTMTIHATVFSRAVQTAAEPMVKLLLRRMRRKLRSWRRPQPIDVSAPALWSAELSPTRSGSKNALDFDDGGHLTIHAADAAEQPVTAKPARHRRRDIKGLPRVAPPTAWTLRAVMWWAVWSALELFTAGALALRLPNLDSVAVLAAALVASKANFGWPAIFDWYCFDGKRAEGMRRHVWRVFDVLMVGCGTFFLVGGLSSDAVTNL